MLAGLGTNAFIFACLTFVPSPSACPLERLWIWHSCKSQTLSSKSQPYPLCFFCIGMQIPGNCEIHPAYERWMQHRSPGGCASIPASHGQGRAKYPYTSTHSGYLKSPQISPLNNCVLVPQLYRQDCLRGASNSVGLPGRLYNEPSLLLHT